MRAWVYFSIMSRRFAGEFVTRKISRVADLVVNHGAPIQLGNLDAKRDWGHTGDYVKGMHAIMQYLFSYFVLSTGRTGSIREFTRLAFMAANVIEFVGSGRDERGIDSSTGRTLVEVNPSFSGQS